MPHDRHIGILNISDYIFPMQTENGLKEISIITLPPERWREFRALRLQALKEEPQAFGSSYEQSILYPDQYWEERLTAGRDILFAEENGNLVGLMGTYADPEYLGAGMIVMVFVLRQARGRGIAGLLMEKILRRLSNRPDIAWAVLKVNVMQESAIRLYTRFGFSITGRERCMMGDGNHHDEYVMRKYLPDIAS